MGNRYLEADMAESITKWLYNREKNPCDYVYPEIPYTFGGKKRKADFIGMYELGDHSYFVGVEAKRTRERLDEVVRQGIRLQSFCHEVYIALPKSSYKQYDQEEKDEVRSLLKTASVGLLLVKKRGPPDVERPVDMDMFNLDLYHSTLELFADRNEDEELSYNEEEGVWSDTQGDAFAESLKRHALLGYDHSESATYSETSDDMCTIYLFHPYNKDIPAKIEIHQKKVMIEVSHEIFVENVVDTLISTYEESDFIELHNVYHKKPRRWEKVGLSEVPYFEVCIPAGGFTFRLGHVPTESTIFHLGSFLKNNILADNEVASNSDAHVKVKVEFDRSQWQGTLTGREGILMDLIHELLEQSSILLAHLIDEE